MHVRTSAGLLALLLGLGCSEDQRPVLESEHLRFHGELEGTCEALGTLYERELARIEASLGRELLEPIDVYMGEAEVERWCSTSVYPDDSLPSGCAPSGTVLATTLFALSHELVHAIRLQHDAHGVPLIEEGLATMLGTARPSVPLVVSVDASDPDVAPIPRLELDQLEETGFDRSIGAHFMHWVGETYGRAALLALLWSDGVRDGDPTAVQAAFAEAIGETMLAAQDRWSNESEIDVEFSDLCYGIDTAQLPAAGLLVEGPACCTDPAAEQGEPNLLRLGSHCFTLPAPTELQVELISGNGQLVLRSDTGDDTLVVLGPGESETITAPACRWKVMYVGPEACEEPTAFRYAVTPL
jgi:hypothetical protein